MLEHFQWKDTDETTAHIKNKKTEVSEKLADVFYWVLLLANKLGIDLVTTFDDKMTKNQAKYPIAKAKCSHMKYTELNHV